MRSSFVRVSKALALAGLLNVLVPAPAFAQGFFEQLFGLSPKPKAMPSLTVPPGQSGYSGPRTPGGSVFPSRDEGSGLRPNGNGEPGGDRGTYRTLCVRTCDGYYFPISNNTTKSNFYRDQAKCKSTCGGEARLFTTPASMSVKPKESVEAMVDLNGMAYTRLPAAFKYRKALVAGCQCKPEPWSEAELDRHRRYAEAEQKAKPGQINAVVARAEPRGEQKKVFDAASPASGPKAVAVAVAKSTDAATAADVKNDGADPVPVKTVSDKSSKRASRVASAVEPGTESPKSKRSATTRTKVMRRPVEVAWTPASQPQVQSQLAQPVAKSTSFFGGGMGLGAGGGKYAWPGDAPRR